ncbi:hypothetical protein ACE193_01770 [Bernardetia sp. OM2101]|uniref:hypothetical protein n=1 Tax=Bernardetia sp. OM2101 TaxID=3344876 RepID=UPI0035D0C81E
MKTNLKTIKKLFIISIIAFNFGCENKKEEKTTQSEEIFNQKSKIDSTLTQKKANSDELKPHQKQFIESFRKTEQTASITDFETKDNKNNAYLTKLSELTNLNHEQVCQISAKFGVYELEKIVDAMPTDSAKTKEAKRLTLLMRFNRLSLPQKGKDYLINKKNESLSKQSQLQSYLDVYQEAAKLHMDINEKIDLNKSNYPKSQKLATLIGVGFEKLALIESQLGVLGLHSAIMNIPDFPKKEEALKIISK